MSADYPVLLRVAGRRCVVVGGGPVAARKVSALVESTADVHVIAVDIVPDIEALAANGSLRVEQRPFEPADLDGAFLAFAATDSRDVNQTVAEAAARYGALVNVADDPSASDFANPGLVRRRGITLAVSTGGRSPAFVRFLRVQLQDWLTDARCTLLELAAEMRDDLRRAGPAPAPAAWRRALDDRRVAEAIEAGDRDGARRRIAKALHSDR